MNWARKLWAAVARESFRDASTSGCCERMRQNSTLSCGYHVEEWECPDVLVVHTSSGLALPCRDGGGSYSPISFCPWCGTTLRPGDFEER